MDKLKVTAMDIVVVSVVFVLILLFPHVDGSMKKGLGFSVKQYRCDDLAAFANLYWWYDWAANFDKMAENNACDLTPYMDTYVPMIWGYRASWKERVREVDKPNHKYILGFNEPNHQGQSDLTPAEAAAAWHLVEKAANGSKIVSPAAAPCGGSSCNGDTKAWFDEFFSILCENETTSPCRVDYLATHHYSCNPYQTMNFLSDLYSTYGLKIWLTEFACPYSIYPQEQLHDYMEPLVNMLEDADYIFRYAWYMARSDGTAGSFITQAVSLLEQSSSQLTELGQFYNSFYRPYTTTTESTPSATTSTTSASTTTTSITSSTTSSTVSTSSSSTPSSTSTTTASSTTTGPSTSSTVVTTVESGSWKIYSLYNSALLSIVCILLYSILMRAIVA